MFITDPKKPVGGHVLAHAAIIRLMLRKGKGKQCVCKIFDAPNLPEGEAISFLLCLSMFTTCANGRLTFTACQNLAIFPSFLAYQTLLIPRDWFLGWREPGSRRPARLAKLCLRISTHAGNMCFFAWVVSARRSYPPCMQETIQRLQHGQRHAMGLDIFVRATNHANSEPFLLSANFHD
jgi:RecA/RadA recombinase